MMKFSFWDRFKVCVKCAISYICLPIALPIVLCFLFLIMRYRIRNLPEVQRRFAELISDKDKHPTLICLNHITRIDSIILASIVFPFWKFFINYSLMAWHVLDFGNLYVFPTLCSIVKTIPVVRMGERKNIRKMQEKVKYLLKTGDLVIIFPEGTRSMNGRIDTHDFQYGVGDILRDLPSCRVLCTYLRGDKQEGRSDVPPYKSTVAISFEMVHPTTTLEGLRASRDLASQVIVKLDEMEKKYFAEQSASWK